MTPLQVFERVNQIWNKNCGDLIMSLGHIDNDGKYVSEGNLRIRDVVRPELEKLFEEIKESE